MHSKHLDGVFHPIESYLSTGRMFQQSMPESSIISWSLEIALAFSRLLGQGNFPFCRLFCSSQNPLSSHSRILILSRSLEQKRNMHLSKGESSISCSTSWARELEPFLKSTLPGLRNSL